MCIYTFIDSPSKPPQSMREPDDPEAAFLPVGLPIQAEAQDAFSINIANEANHPPVQAESAAIIPGRRVVYIAVAGMALGFSNFLVPLGGDFSSAPKSAVCSGSVG